LPSLGLRAGGRFAMVAVAMTGEILIPPTGAIS